LVTPNIALASFILQCLESSGALLSVKGPQIFYVDWVVN